MLVYKIFLVVFLTSFITIDQAIADGQNPSSYSNSYEVKLFRKHLDTALFAAENQEWSDACIHATLAKSIILNSQDKQSYLKIKKFTEHVCNQAGIDYLK